MSLRRTRIDLDDLHDLAFGAAFLGTGGGGDPYIGRLMAAMALERVGGSVPLVPLEDVEDDWFVIAAGNMGAPTVLIEKLPSGDEPAAAVRVLEGYLGRRCDAIIPFEAGGVNSTLPLLIAAELGIPVIDADGMGRAFPELQMETFAAMGVPASPMVVINEYGDFCIIEAHDAPMTEWIARGVTIRMGGQTSIAEYSMEGAVAKRVSVPGTMSLCMEIGAAARQARSRGQTPLEAILDLLPKTHYRHASCLYEGKISDLERRTERGFAVGHIHIEAFDGDQPPLSVTFQNENLVARQDGRVLAIVPDLICILDHETGEPITTEWLRYGQRVSVVGVAVPEIMRSQACLRLFGPQAFGIDDPFVPLEHST